MTTRSQHLDQALDYHLRNTCFTTPAAATGRDWYRALAHVVRDDLAGRWQETQSTYESKRAKQVHYLSAEFLLGRALSQNLLATDLFHEAQRTLEKRGLALSEVLEGEPDPGLGNGGLGRLAACFLESMATLGIPGFGQGIRYQYGIFEQQIRAGQQVEIGDDWLRYGNVWEVPKPDERVTVMFYGRTQHHVDENGQFSVRWVDTKKIWGIPYDTPVAGFGTPHVNTLRLWSAQPMSAFDLSVFNAGDYRMAVEERTLVEAISKVLYPADHTDEGKELRLKQQVFFCTCAVADIMRRFDQKYDDINDLPGAMAIQLNDTHPAITVAELMRVLVDERHIPWDQAWELTTATTAYTNHTLMPEALEKWPAMMFRNLLPRHFEIIQEIDRRFLRQVIAKWPNDDAKVSATRIISHEPEYTIRMAHLATVGSHRVNGVAALHSELIKSTLLPDFHDLYPAKFVNKTNGVTPRRWVHGANPALSSLITEVAGEGWQRDLAKVQALDAHASDTAMQERIREIKSDNKRRLADALQRQHGLILDHESIFDIQIKRIHEYKRQLLAALYAISRYLRIKDGEDLPPRTLIFGGKAAPGYAVAKHHIRFIHDVSSMIALDPAVRDRLNVVFVPNYNVSWAELLIPAANLSEQISMAGKEASGTGNMKFAMNGALTIGTLDGANVEIREAVGEENFFLFGHTADEVRTLKRSYRPSVFIEQSPALSRVLELVESGFFSHHAPDRYHGLVHALRHEDTWLVCADFDEYADAQDRVDQAWLTPTDWTCSAIRNIARVHRFSSDRTISEYASEIWNTPPVELNT